MHRINRWFAAAAITFIAIPGCAKDLFDLKINDVVTRQIELGESVLPLPPGDWTVVTRSETFGEHKDTKIPIANALLIQVKEGKFVSALRYIGNREHWHATGWTDDPCSVKQTKDAYFKESFSSGYTFPECLYTRPVTSFTNGSGGYWEDMRKWFGAHSVTIPPTVVYVDFSSYQKKGFIHASAWINPEIAGFPRDEESQLTLNTWNATKIDDARKAYLSKIQSWGRTLADQVRTGFGGSAAELPPAP